MLNRTIAPAFHIPSEVALERVHSHTLKNGIAYHELILGEQEVCRIEIILKSGLWYEPGDGLSFFTSKMLLEGTHTLSARQIADRLDYYGAFWEVSTGTDVITISIFTLSKYLEEVVPFFIEVITEAAFPEKELDTLRKVRLQQLRVKRQKTASMAMQGFLTLLYGTSHPYGKEATEDQVQGIQAESLKAFYSSSFFHQPEVFVSGRITENQTEKLKKWVEQLPVQSAYSVTHRMSHVPFVREIIPLQESSQSTIRMGALTVSKHHPKHCTLLVLNEIFGGYFGSRLMKNIREDKGYTYGIYSSISYFHSGSFWVVGADVNREVALTAIEEIVKEMQKLKNEPVPGDELAIVKNYMAGTFLASVNTPFSILDKFKSIHFSGLDYSYYDHLLSGIRSVQPEEVQEAANEFLDEDAWIQVIAGGI